MIPHFCVKKKILKTYWSWNVFFIFYYIFLFNVCFILWAFMNIFGLLNKMWQPSKGWRIGFCETWGNSQNSWAIAHAFWWQIALDWIHTVFDWRIGFCNSFSHTVIWKMPRCKLGTFVFDWSKFWTISSFIQVTNFFSMN